MPGPLTTVYEFEPLLRRSVPLPDSVRLPVPPAMAPLILMRPELAALDSCKNVPVTFRLNDAAAAG